jgi:hypothetical protein
LPQRIDNNALLNAVPRKLLLYRRAAKITSIFVISGCGINDIPKRKPASWLFAMAIALAACMPGGAKAVDSGDNAGTKNNEEVERCLETLREAPATPEPLFPLSTTENVSRPFGFQRTILSFLKDALTKLKDRASAIREPLTPQLSWGVICGGALKILLNFQKKISAHLLRA